MPNNIDNLLTVHGDPESVAQFVRAARGVTPPTGDPQEADDSRFRATTLPLCFHALVPLPPEYSQRPYGDGSIGCGFDLECETWGIKWGAYSPRGRTGKGVAEPECEPGLATYYFGTAWDGPHAVFMPKVAARFPGLSFLLSWGGEGPTRGRGWWHAGGAEVKVDPYRKADYPEYGETMSEAEERAYGKAYEVAERLRLTEHWVWVAHRLAAWAGHPFDPGADPRVIADWIQEQGLDGLAAKLRGEL